MSKNRKNKKRNRPQSQAPVQVHRYSAEEEDKKTARKKLKIRLIVSALLSAIVFAILLLIF